MFESGLRSGMAVGSCGSVLAATKLCANIIQPGSVDTIGLTVFWFGVF